MKYKTNRLTTSLYNFKKYKFVWLLVLSTATSCVSPKKMVYFQNMEVKEEIEVVKNFETKIQVGDILSINVSAVDGEAVLPFNLYDVPITQGAYGDPLTYLVDIAGEINFPVLGTIKVSGSSTKELTKSLEGKLKDYIKNPTVNVRIENFKITVLGEVKNPGTFKIDNERISIIEALGLAGDLGIQANRNNILLVREINKERKFVSIDLTDKKLFASPYFYLAQNDVIYVEPNRTKINSSAIGANTGTIISSISILISVVALLLR